MYGLSRRRTHSVGLTPIAKRLIHSIWRIPYVLRDRRYVSYLLGLVQRNELELTEEFI